MTVLRWPKALGAVALLALSVGLPLRAETPRELVVWAMGEEGKKIQVLARRFEAENPGVTVRTQAVPWDAAYEKLLTSVVGNIPPDVCQLGTTWMAGFVKMGALDEFPMEDNRFPHLKESLFFPGSWNTTLYEGQSYGVPWYVDTRVLFYRKDLLNRAGFTTPPATWEELKAAALALKALPDIAGPHYGLSLGVKDWGALAMFVWQNGGDILQPASVEFREALETYVSFFREGLSPKELAAEVDLLHAFKTGYFPMFISGPWMVELIRSDMPNFKDKWSVSILPGKKTRASFVGGANLVVFKDSPHKDLAWTFVDFMSRPEVQVEWYRITKDLPPTPAAWEADEFQKDPLLQTFGLQMGTAISPPNIAQWEEVTESISNALERAILVQNTSADQWVTETAPLQEAVDKIQLARKPPSSSLPLYISATVVILATLGGWMFFAARRRKEAGFVPVSWRSSLPGYMFILPAAVPIVIFLLAPIAVSFFLSMTDMDVFRINRWHEVRFVGLQNYLKVLTDGMFWKTVGNTVVFAGIGVPLTIGASLFAAVGLNQGYIRGRTIFRTSLFAPVVTTIVAVAVVWRWLYNPDYGLLNWGLRSIGLSPLNWLSDTRYALFSLILMAVWKNFGYYMVIFLAGLQAIPQSLYEAARIDGASSWQCFRHITLPGVRPTMILVSILTGITYLQFFGEPYIMTKGGPLNSTNSIVLYMYNHGFKFFRLGYASAVAYMLFGMIFILSLILMRWRRETDSV